MKNAAKGIRGSLLMAGLTVIALGLMLGVPSVALADDCAALGGVIVNVPPNECQVSTLNHHASGSKTLDETLHILSGGSIIVDAPSISIEITSGDFVMDTGALINGNVNGGNCPGTGRDITVTLDNGDVDLRPGSIIRSNSCSGGKIKITTSDTHTVDIDGTVESVGAESGVANQPPGGGPITIVAGCGLTVSDSGLVSSRGRDPGADLVHLEGCTVVIDGVVESTGVGHALPVNPANHCNLDPAAHPLGGASFFTACVEVWGNTVTINSTGSHKGEVRADGIRNPGRAWIDVFANKDITINNDTLGAYSLHANGATVTNSNSFGGLITVKSLSGKVATSGTAIQANATGAGSDGGDVIVQAGGAGAAGDVAFGTASIQAKGNADNNVNTFGGHISARSFNGSVTGSPGGELNTAAGTANGPGTVLLEACVGNPATTYAGTVIGAETDHGPGGAFCGGAPTFPLIANWSTGQTVGTFLANADTCDARCGQLCSKSGRKFNDLTGNGIDDPAFPGISGVTIHIFNQPGTPAFHDHQVTGANGAYSFINLLPGSYFVCEQGGPPSQTFPLADQTNGACAAHTGVAGSRGYAVTLVAGTDSCTDTGNDFGNHVQTPGCPEDPTAVLTRSVLNPGSGVPDYPTLQAAYDAAADTGETIGMFGITSENVTLGGAKTLKITECTVARLTAKDSGLPVWNITSTGKLTIVGPDSVGGTIGWWLQTPNHTLKSIRANGASQYGVLVGSNGNSVSWNDVSGNGPGAGIRVTGSGNTLTGGTVGPNTGDGVELVGNSNTLSGATVQSNTINGVVVLGNTNAIKSNKANLNVGDGFNNANGVNNKYSGNSSNTGGKENGGAEYRFVTTGIDGGSNRADGVNVPSAAKGCTSFNAGQVCE